MNMITTSSKIDMKTNYWLLLYKNKMYLKEKNRYYKIHKKYEHHV